MNWERKAARRKCSKSEASRAVLVLRRLHAGQHAAGIGQAGGRSLGLLCRKGCPFAPGVGFEAGAAGGVVSSRRKTSRAVITRTIIDGSTVDMRESPLFSYGMFATGLTGTPRIGLMSNPSSYCFTLARETKRSLLRKRCWSRHSVNSAAQNSVALSHNHSSVSRKGRGRCGSRSG
jgi:hypothetical protein